MKSYSANDDMTFKKSKTCWYDSTVFYLLITIPIANLVINIIAWLSIGIDLPVLDDWRSWRSGEIGSFSLDYLFKPVNDTLYPVGAALDSLFFRLLDGNTIAKQFITLTLILGLLLLLQWRLLRAVISEKIIAASLFCLTLPMLQPGSYWGEQNIAYHQAIPLVCIFGVLYYLFARRWQPVITFIIVLVLATISGLSYISGAFAILCLSCTLLVISRFIDPNERKSWFWGGLAVFIPAVLTTLAQIWVIAVVQKGTHRPDAPMAYPFEGDFWFYILGKVGRSLLMPTKYPIFGMVITFLTVAIILVLVVIVCYRFIHLRYMSSTAARAGTIFIILFSIVLVYLCLIAAGRTNLRPDTISSAPSIFAFGFHRFHFFWVTILWPWVAAVGLVVSCKIRKSSWIRVVAPLVAILFAILLFIQGVFDHDSYYRYVTNRRLQGLSCMLTDLQKGGKMFCPSLDVVDVSAPYLFALSHSSSFIRYLPMLGLPIEEEPFKPLFRLSKEGTTKLSFKDIEIIEHAATEYRLRAGNDSWMTLKTGDADALKRCVTVEVGVRLRVLNDDLLQVFYTDTNGGSYNDNMLKSIPTTGGKEFQDIVVMITNPVGFSDTIRIDPVLAPQEFEIEDIVVRCRLMGAQQ